MSKTDMERLGVFQEMPYTSIGDPYMTMKSRDLDKPQCKGRQILSESTKSKSANKDGYFKDFTRVFEGEGYADPIGTLRRNRMKLSKKNTGKTWVPSSGSKSYSGFGSTYGTIAGTHTYFSGTMKNRPSIKQEKRNVITNPPKKGSGFGYLDVTINPYPEYKPEPYNATVSAKQLLLLEQKAQGRPPFKVNTYGQEFFDKDVYNMEGYKTGFRNFKKSEPIGKPFIPTSPTKLDGGMKDGTINKFPYYKSSTFMDRRLPFQVFNVVNSTGKTFVPNPGSKTCVTKSILFANIDKTLNNQNYRGYKNDMVY